MRKSPLALFAPKSDRMVLDVMRNRRSLTTRNVGANSLAFLLSRSSAVAPETDTVTQRANAFATAVRDATRKKACVTLLTARDERAISSYVITPGQGANSHVVTTLCSTLGAKATPVEDPAELDFIAQSPRASFLVARPASTASFATQAGGDQNEVAILLGRLLQPGSWVAITLRAPTKPELRRTRKWFDHRRESGSVSHYTNHPSPLIATVFAGGSSDDDVAMLLSQVVSVIPGFDLETISYNDLPRFSPRWSLPIGLVTGVATQFGLHQPTFSICVGLAAAIIAFIVSKVPPPGADMEKKLRASRSLNALPSPSARTIPPLPPVRRTQRRPDGTTREIDRAGQYPLAPSSLLLGPAMSVGLVSPHSGANSSAADTEYRSVPAELLDDIGPVVAYAQGPGPDGALAPVHLDANEFYGGVGALGLPKTGKTTLLHNLWAWHTLERVMPSNLPGRPGRRNALIAFESKGDGTPVYERWSRSFGDALHVVEVADPTTPAIDIADVTLPPRERARLFVSAMKYAWDESAIQALSTETLKAVLTAAMSCPPEVAEATQSLTRGDVTFMSIAHLLLGGGGSYDDAKQIAANLTAVANERPDDAPDKATLLDAVASLNILFGPDSTQAKWSQAVASSRNKIDLLMAVPHWWSPNRPRGSWASILENHAAVVVNSGVSKTGHILDEDVGSAIAAMTAYSLKIALQQTCSGWEAEQRYVSIFADEIGVLAKSSSEVIEWLRAQGRSYGVRPFLAAQWPDQLPAKVRSSFMSFATMFWFQQSDHNVINDAVGRLSVGGGEWTGADIANLEKYQAILHASAAGRLRMPVPVKMAYWTDPARFAEDQGFASVR